jgi:acyl-CoA reductase-like NAD-dependent aldehyde dehydrogenase
MLQSVGFHELQDARMMIRTASVAALMLAIATAHAEYFTYSDWSKQPAEFRAAYIAGLYDALISMAETNAEAKIGAHYQACVVRAKMRNGQLAENTLLYGSARRELQSGGVGTVMINYLIQLCGKPPH